LTIVYLFILDAIKEKTGYDLNGKSEEEIRQVCKELKMEEIDETMGKGKLIDEIFGEFCEGTYIQPTFITIRRMSSDILFEKLVAISIFAFSSASDTGSLSI